MLQVRRSMEPWPAASVGCDAVVGPAARCRFSHLRWCPDRARCVIEDSIVGAGATIGDSCSLRSAVIADRGQDRYGQRAARRCRVWPDVTLQDCAVSVLLGSVTSGDLAPIQRTSQWSPSSAGSRSRGGAAGQPMAIAPKGCQEDSPRAPR